MKNSYPLLSLRPTQFAVGIFEIETKIAELKRMKKRKLKKHLNEMPVPVVVSPRGELFIIDHHHFVFACWGAGIKRLKIKVVSDLSKSRLSYMQFWRKMRRSNWTYLHDQFGEGPRLPLYLPADVLGMADDPYRSLAWLVKKLGGYEDSGEMYSEFLWANFFRQRGLLDTKGRSAIEEVAKRSVPLAQSPAAKHLPGFTGRNRKAPVKAGAGRKH